jgi:hypothetical protein
LLPNLARFLYTKDRSTLRHALELHLFLDFFITVFAVPLSERMFRACTVELGAASRTPSCWGSKGFAAHRAIGYVITKQTYIKLTDKA